MMSDFRSDDSFSVKTGSFDIFYSNVGVYVCLELSFDPGLQAWTKWSPIRLNSRSRFYSNFFLNLG